MNIKPIKTPEDHRAALQEINGLMMAEMGSPEGDRLDVLTTLVEAYEAKHFPMEMADPVDAIKFTMEQRGLTARDLQPMIGQLNRVYEILNGKRMLTLPMIWRLHKAFGIPAEALIKPPSSLCATI
jgi:HTH-type transcriptional regulator/antitoxin HigA